MFLGQDLWACLPIEDGKLVATGYEEEMLVQGVFRPSGLPMFVAKVANKKEEFLRLREAQKFVEDKCKYNRSK